MKAYQLIAIAGIVALGACQNQTKEAINDADSANAANRIAANDSMVNQPATTEFLSTDKDGSEFLVRAAAAGSNEVKGAKLGQEKSSNADVKNFSEMLVKEHEANNQEVVSLANSRRVTLPADTMNPMLKDLGDLEGNKFDRKYMDHIVKDHKDAINLFEKYKDKTSDTAIKDFIQKTLPVLRLHLDSARAIEKKVKNAK